MKKWMTLEHGRMLDDIFFYAPDGEKYRITAYRQYFFENGEKCPTYVGWVIDNPFNANLLTEGLEPCLLTPSDSPEPLNKELAQGYQSAIEQKKRSVGENKSEDFIRGWCLGWNDKDRRKGKSEKQSDKQNDNAIYAMRQKKYCVQ